MKYDLKTYIRQQREKTPLGIMTHMVAGYPHFKANLEMAQKMENAGAELLEIQLPFSDPMADGSVIMRANQKAIEQGTKIRDCFAMIKEMSQSVSLPIIAMTYYNIPFHMGLEKYFQQCEMSNITGIIVPDIPFDEKREKFYQKVNDFDLQAIPVFSPTMTPQRITQALKYFSATLQEKWTMNYSTLRVSATGEKKNVEESGIHFLRQLSGETSIPIAAGFGLSEPQQLKKVAPHAQIAVIGSHLIRLFEEKGISAIESFIRECIEVIKK